MRYVLGYIIALISIPFVIQGQFITPDINSSILNKNLNNAIQTNLSDDPLRDGAFFIINDGSNNPSGTVQNIIGNDTRTQIGTFGNAKNRIIAILNSIVNYTLGLLALVALVYLLYHGLMMLTATGDEERYNTGLGGLKYAAIALTGIGLSWFVVSLLFYIVDFIIA